MSRSPPSCTLPPSLCNAPVESVSMASPPVAVSAASSRGAMAHMTMSYISAKMATGNVLLDKSSCCYHDAHDMGILPGKHDMRGQIWNRDSRLAAVQSGQGADCLSRLAFLCLSALHQLAQQEGRTAHCCCCWRRRPLLGGCLALLLD
jgi:hypothetical protein